jgi:hypothetical protein
LAMAHPLPHQTVPKPGMVEVILGRELHRRRL